MRDLKEPQIPGHVVLRGLVGSTVHGLAVSDGLEDRDEMGVMMESIHEALREPKTYTYRTAEIRAGKNARSMAGDLDLVVHPLRKFVSLALKGNPTILNLFFVPREQCVKVDGVGHELRVLADKIISKKAAGAFLGYLKAQRDRLTGDRAKNGNRPELVEKYGFDTKFAMHMLRLGFQGVELLETGRMSLPMQAHQVEYLRGVRTGHESLERCLAQAKVLEDVIFDFMSGGRRSPLPERPDEAWVNGWVCRKYQQHWRITADSI